MKVAAVILAAGGSSRMGTPKQTLAYGSTTLLRRAVETALSAGCEPVVVVVGAERSLVSSHLEGLTVCLVDNPLWQQGLGSSISTGIEALVPSAIDAAIILAFRPAAGLRADHVRKLVEAAQTQQASIVASGLRGDVWAFPHLFKTQRVSELLLAIQSLSGRKSTFFSPGLQDHRDSIARSRAGHRHAGRLPPRFMQYADLEKGNSVE